MLCINVEMNMEGELRKLRKTEKLHFKWRDCWPLSLTSYHFIGNLGWQLLPEITKTAIITHRVNKCVQFLYGLVWYVPDCSV